MCKLANDLLDYANAGFAGIYIKSYEHEDALGVIGEVARKHNWQVHTWDTDDGLQCLTGGNNISKDDNPQALPAIHALLSMEKESEDQHVFLVLKNFHMFIDKPPTIQALDHAIMRGKKDGRFIIILSSVLKLPCEIEKHFVVLDHKLPDQKEIDQILTDLTKEGEVEPDQRKNIIESAAGLTRFEAENAIALSLVRKGKVSVNDIWEIKEATIRKSGLMTLYKGVDDFATLGGLSNLKEYCKNSLINTNQGKSKVKVMPKGVMLLGVSGTGKSAFAKALGNEVGRPTITLDIGALMGSLVGQTEENTRKALAVADEMEPCIVFIDEIEKALGGTSGSGSNDSGVSKRMLGAFLTWLNDHKTNVYVICTSNDISSLPPEFTRAGRFDGIFFIDIPTTEQKNMIWPIYEDLFGIEEQERPDDTNWTGSEIKTCCEQAVRLGTSLIKASKYVVPVAVTAHDRIQSLRQYSSGRFLSSECEGVYNLNEQTYEKTSNVAQLTKGRKINRPIK